MEQMITKEVFLKAIKEKIKFSFMADKLNIQDTWNIGYGLDDNAARTAGVSIVSICENNKNKKIVFHLLCNDISAKNIDNFKFLAQKYKVEINLILVDIREPVFSQRAKNIHIPLPAWFRIFFPYIISEGRFLYIDTDVICIDTIDEIFSIDIDEYFVAVVSDVEPMRSKKIRMLNLSLGKYFNSGVILMNLSKWRENNITEQIDALAVQRNDLLDQDILNIIFEDKKHIYLDKKYNSIELWKNENVKDALKQTKLIHFASQPKPWSILWQYEKRPYMENVYKNYEEISPWKGLPLDLPKTYHHKRWYAEKLRNKGKLLSSLYWYWQYIKGKYNLGSNN